MRFPKVIIKKESSVVEYSSRVFNHERFLKGLQKVDADFQQMVESRRVPYEHRYDKWLKARSKWERTRNERGERREIENVRWVIVDKATGDRIKSCDSIQQAKKYCIENDLDMGMFS